MNIYAISFAWDNENAQSSRVTAFFDEITQSQDWCRTFPDQFYVVRHEDLHTLATTLRAIVGQHGRVMVLDMNDIPPTMLWMPDQVCAWFKKVYNDHRLPDDLPDDLPTSLEVLEGIEELLKTPPRD